MMHIVWYPDDTLQKENLFLQRQNKAFSIHDKRILYVLLNLPDDSIRATEFQFSEISTSASLAAR